MRKFLVSVIIMLSGCLVIEGDDRSAASVEWCRASCSTWDEAPADELALRCPWASSDDACVAECLDPASRDGVEWSPPEFCSAEIWCDYQVAIGKACP